MDTEFTNKRAETFLNNFSSGLSKEMYVPDEFAKFFHWAGANNCIGKSNSGEDFIVVDALVLGPSYKSSLMIHKPVEDPWWLGSENPRHNSRLKVFAKTGADGSSAAFWLDEKGEQQIVHLGSGSGSTMIGKWVDSPLDFLRLLAIGYAQLCWPEEYDRLPSELIDEGEMFHQPTRLRSWLEKEFDVVIPKRASNIVKKMSEIGAESSDPFCKWVGAVRG